MTNTLNKIMHDGDEYLLPDTTYTAGSGISIDQNNEISNTGVTSVNGQTGAVTILESQTKVFPMPEVGDDISDLVSWLSAGKIAVLFAGYDTPGDRDGQYYQIYSFEEGIGTIYCERTSPDNDNTIDYRINYNTSTYIVREKAQTVRLFAPMGGTAGQVLTQNSNGLPSWENPAGTTYEAGDGIAIGEKHKDTQGPCPDGFHVPTIEEWSSLNNLWLNITDYSNASYFSETMLFPLCRVGWKDGEGYLTPSDLNWQEDYRDTEGYARYRSSTLGQCFDMDYDTGPGTYNENPSTAMPIRAFSDKYITPDSSWTIKHGTLGGAGIFHSSTLGLISITDGTTGYTIADKNLGATTVWDYWNKFTQANCGLYYQRGNNHGFPLIWGSPTSTSSTQVDASAYGPENYYNSDTFIESSTNWDNSDNDNLWGGTTNGTRIDENGNVIYNTGVLSVNGQTGDVNFVAGDNIQINGTTISATDTTYNAGQGISIEDISINGRQGPSPNGFHVPSQAERQGLKTIMDWLSLTTGDGWRINLHIPFVGSRDFSDASLSGQGSSGLYWSSSPYFLDPNWASLVAYFTSSFIGVDNNSYLSRAVGSPIRCFKNEYVAPDSSWTVVQGTLGGAGIFWNQNEGLISITNGSTGYTIMDKNLGATIVYNDGDTLTQDNMGNMYQWGNNYGFPSTGTISKTSSTKVDASSYGPTNPYSSDTFIIGSSDWSSVRNDDLWGDTTGTYIQENTISVTVASTEYTAGEGIEIGIVQDYSAMQGPSPDGFHVPLVTEWQGLNTIMTLLSLTTGDDWRTNLHMPLTGSRRSSDASHINQGNNGFYWSSSPGSHSYRSAPSFCLDSDVYVDIEYNRASCYSVRSFKDAYETPDSSWMVVQGALGSAGIFWDQSAGLISITDGSTGYTIMDKNLGATTVYNSGDTLSQANCGNFYQRGNNYGFPWTGNVTTSSTQVDASSYGPGNYYESDTFITLIGDWSSVQNDNLRGGVTGVLTSDNVITNTGVLVSDQPNNILTSGMKIRAGLETDYQNLGSYDSQTLYLTVE